MLSRKKSSSNASLHAYLQSKVRENRGEAQKKGELLLSVVAPEELFKQFLLSGSQFKGQLDSGYNDSGTKVSADVTVTFLGAGIKVPGLNLYAGLYASAGVNTSRSKRDLIVIHRQCDDTNPQPICLMGLTGYICEIGAGVRAGAGFELALGPSIKTPSNAQSRLDNATNIAGAPNLELPEEKSLNLICVEGDASAGLSYQGTYMALSAPTPTWHASIMDSNLLNNFTILLGSGKKDELKKTVLVWLKQQSDTYNINPPLTSLTSEGRTRSLTAFLDMKWESTVPSDTLIKDLTRLETGLKQQQSPQDLLMLRYYRQRLQQLKSSNQSGSPTSTSTQPLNSLCQLSLWSHGGGADATTQVTATVPRIGSASAGASIEGVLKYTAYRFQSFNGAGKKPIVITQDTVISYRQVKISAQAEATLKYPSINAKSRTPTTNTVEGSAEVEKSLYNMMTYESTIAYWHYPSTENVGQVEALVGSGICFGVSVSIPRLIKLATFVEGEGTASYQQECKSLRTTLSKSLHISQSDLEKFLEDLRKTWFVETWVVEADEETFPTDMVLLEVGFPAIGCSLPVTWDSITTIYILGKPNTQYDPKKEPSSNLKRKALGSDDGNSSSPESIRIRFRIADLRNNSRTKFKLGIPALVADFNIELEEIDNVGVEGIVDLHTYWVTSKSPDPASAASGSAATHPDDVVVFHLDPVMDPVMDSVERYKTAVPPVALLHQ